MDGVHSLLREALSIILVVNDLVWENVDELNALGKSTFYGLRLLLTPLKELGED